MPRFISARNSRLQLAVARQGALGACAIVAVHVAAVAIMAWTEVDPVGWALFILAWGLLNFLWLVLLRRLRRRPTRLSPPVHA